MIIFLKHILKVFPLILLRYIFFAGIAYLIFYIWKREKYFNHKIQSKYPDRKNIRREMLYSVLSLAIFALVGGMVYWLRIHGHTKIYTDFNAHSVGYFFFSAVVFILLHDTYFYWMHRFMHWDRIYKYVHRIHHLSTNPTPWAAFAFHPLEAVVEVAILPVMVFLIPLHPYAILIWVIYQTVLNVMGHLGFEMFPSGFTTNLVTAGTIPPYITICTTAMSAATMASTTMSGTASWAPTMINTVRSSKLSSTKYKHSAILTKR